VTIVRGEASVGEKEKGAKNTIFYKKEIEEKKKRVIREMIERSLQQERVTLLRGDEGRC